jgi:hypothetical protein
MLLLAPTRWRVPLLLGTLCALLLGAIVPGPLRFATAQTTPTPFPADFMRSVKAYGAQGDGVTDDTAAIQAALNDARVDANGQPLHNDYYGRPKALYFPAGTYLVSATLRWIGCCVLLQGQGPGPRSSSGITRPALAIRPRPGR